jgi:hypothetical protein
MCDDLFRGSVGIPCLIDGCRARPDQLSIYSAPRYIPEAGYALRLDVGRDNRLTITRHHEAFIILWNNPKYLVGDLVD